MHKILEVMPVMMHLAFKEKIPTTENLTSEQVQVLQAIVDQKFVWNFGNAINLLREYSLPQNKEELIELITKASQSKQPNTAL